MSTLKQLVVAYVDICPNKELDTKVEALAKEFEMEIYSSEYLPKVHRRTTFFMPKGFKEHNNKIIKTGDK